LTANEIKKKKRKKKKEKKTKQADPQLASVPWRDRRNPSLEPSIAVRVSRSRATGLLQTHDETALRLEAVDVARDDDDRDLLPSEPGATPAKIRSRA
jgi:hypothetical protein